MVLEKPRALDKPYMYDKIFAHMAREIPDKICDAVVQGSKPGIVEELTCRRFGGTRCFKDTQTEKGFHDVKVKSGECYADRISGRGGHAN